MRALPLLSRPPVKHGQAQGTVTLVALGSQALEDLDHVWESRSKLTGYKREEGETAKGKKETRYGYTRWSIHDKPCPVVLYRALL